QCTCCFWMKLFSHAVHVKGRSPVWIRLCRFRCSLFQKFFPHSSHVWGSFMWICWCSLRCTGFSPVWILLWTLRVCLQLKLLPQSLHTCKPCVSGSLPHPRCNETPSPPGGCSGVF
uniref:Uncharacterized protein n=1 Tax=Chelonoidis abingdonii TaxID=106734 RepID=A0A8C0G8P0_CHEAB